jgi:hypothetical protein
MIVGLFPKAQMEERVEKMRRIDGSANFMAVTTAWIISQKLLTGLIPAQDSLLTRDYDQASMIIPLKLTRAGAAMRM